MKTFDYPEHHCGGAGEAVELARALCSDGTYDLFRGQRHTFPIAPSIARADIDSAAASARLSSFAQWVHSTSDLKSLHNNPDAILAVAQHYGLRTPLMDVSTSPDIAGFFATDGGEDGHTGTIICINRAKFIASWQDLNDQYRLSSGHDLTSIIEIDVRNLWRLDAQQGLFIRCHVDSTMLETFSHMLHIYFPQKAGTKIVDRDSVYPKERSHLEVLLNQYFLIETYEERSAALSELFQNTVSISAGTINNEIASFFIGNAIPRHHESWNQNELDGWLDEPSEPLPPYGSRHQASLLIPESCETADLEAHIQNHIKSAKVSAKPFRGHINWDVIYSDGTAVLYSGDGISSERTEFTEFSVSQMVNTIYDGMRYLPFTDLQISRAIARYLAMVTFGCYNIIQDAEGVEFVARNVRGRGFCSRSKIEMAVRDDFYSLIKDDHLEPGGKMSFRDLLFSASDVRSSYVFNRFLDIFVEDLIPSQASIAIEGLVIGLNPAQIEVFGES